MGDMTSFVGPEAWYTLWGLMVAWMAIADCFVVKGLFQNLGMGTENIFQPVQSLL
jgi:hypothetical protein